MRTARGWSRGAAGARADAEDPAAEGRARARRIGLRGFLWTMALTVAGCTAATLVLPHNDYVRYQSLGGTIFERLGWIYERIHFDPEPIDVLLVGSSRTARGVPAAELEEALAARGLDLSVANISLPAAGFDLRMTKLREVVRTKDPAIVVWGVVEQLPRDGHQAFGDVAPVGELLTSPPFVNRNLPANLARLPYRQIELALASFAPEAFGLTDDFDAEGYLGPAPDLRLLNEAGWSIESEDAVIHTPEHAEALGRESERRRRQIRPPLLPEALGWAEFGVSRAYLDRLTALAEDEGFEVAFLFLPFYRGHEAPLDTATIEAHGPIWSASFLTQDPSLYADAAHASHLGTDLIVPWLAQQVGGALTGGGG